MSLHLHQVAASAAQTDARLGVEDRRRFEQYLREILGALGLDVSAEDTQRTPARLLSAWLDATSGYLPDAKLQTLFPLEPRDGEIGDRAQIIEGPIGFSSLCEHHVLPFHGEVTIGYVADQCLIGLSKLTRITRQYARRFTMQERLGRDVAAALERLIRPRGVAVHIEAQHLCTRMRGVCETTARTRTTLWRGTYETSAGLRTEFLALCGAGPHR